MRSSSIQENFTASAAPGDNNTIQLSAVLELASDSDKFLDVAKRHRFSKFIVLDINRRSKGKLRPKIRTTNLDNCLFAALATFEELGESMLFSQIAATNVPYVWRLAPDCATAKPIVSTPVDDKLIRLFNERRIRVGYCVPVFDMRGRRHVVIYFAEHLGAMDRHPDLVLDTIECFQEVFGEDEQTEPEPAKPLNEGERQCLLWASRGKTSHEISIILSLSEHTVNHYFTSSTQKLGASGRIHAVVKAIDHGLIDTRCG